MKTLNQRLFFCVNRQLGKRPALDGLFLVVAHWFIYILFVLCLVWADVTLPGIWYRLYIKVVLTTIVSGIVVSWMLAMFWVHKRPMGEFPEAKFLFQPYKNKSFPSDHTMISFLLVFITYFFGAHWFVILLLTFLAGLVGFSRIWVGVHYPRDVAGGIFFALVFSYFGYYLVTYISQPLYNHLLLFWR
ncbi:MAG TPA: phosphatase PAP2 family protein [Patescibacteria group bacterium]|nr:phosphatase PAP2 family protein [Patescibacteria group bacterium]